MENGELAALKAVNFDWTLSLDSIWQTPAFHNPNLHQYEKQILLNELTKLKEPSHEPYAKPLGRVIAGSPGSGKTAILAELRQHAASLPAFFVLVNMTDIRDFWETVLLGYLESLQREMVDGQSQLDDIVWYLLKLSGGLTTKAVSDVDNVRELMNNVLKIMLKEYPRETLDFSNVVRAVILLGEDDFELREVGYTWLQGLEVDAADQQRFGLRRNPAPPAYIIQGLSWLMGLVKPTLLAFDQVDNIVSNHMHLLDVPNEESAEPRYEASRRLSLNIIEGLAGGLMALWDNLSRTLMLAVCTDTSWDILEKNAFGSTTDRFHSPLLLKRLPNSALAEDIVARRLAAAWQAHNITPPYPSWPFASSFFTRHGDWFPRDLLKACDKHRNSCCQKGQVLEIFQPEIDPSSKSPPENLHLEPIDNRLRGLLNIDTGNTFDDKQLGDIIRLVCRGLRDELILPENIDAIVDQDFNYHKSPVLHARLRLIYRQEGDREDHYAIRALQKTHHTAFQSRLKAAVTASGIDRHLPFRHLLLLRTTPLPTGMVTEQKITAFKQDGGILHWPDATELKILVAVAQLVSEAPSDLAAWLRIRRPLSGLPLFQQTGLRPFLPLLSETNTDEDLKGRAAPVSIDPSPVKTKPEQLTLPETPPLTPSLGPDAPLNKSELPLGHRLVGHQPSTSQPLVTLPLHLLRRHTVILAGAGSGKTVLVRRLVEEAALRGIPSLVIDTANDLSRLGKPWPEAPEGWLATDAQLARHYFEQTETLIWTPGIQRGNPLYLDPLPNLAAVADDADMLQQVVSSAHSNLAHLVAPGNSAKARSRQGVLAAALMYFAQQGLQGLETFIDLLADLPLEAGGGISQAAKLADDMANQLKSERLTNVLWQQAGVRLDPAVLLGLNQPAVTRISVINLAGIPQLEHQQQFMAQLGTLLFVWLKKHPASDARPLQGLLIIDEAKDFVPAGSSTPCKEALLRLAAQARKYGMGLIFASQAPKSIDHNVVANCTTQFYGRTNSPAAIETVKNLLQEKGGRGHDVATLSAGQFYVHSEGFAAPLKIKTPLCLSWHSASPPQESEVHSWAAAVRANL